ncbi:Pentapeptide repeats (9 copies) [Arsenophonus nasoniae]|uniref:Pentapeptide repeats (9 copies) n=1 Tax=Arsenophonus nasoniae TaxID=638 RepID=A0A4P7KUE0_9GAMM|nr:Pentapeptide repeats (9 copies) [Arsenophonus nasoniae]
MRVPTSKSADPAINSAHTSLDSPSRFQRLSQVISTIYNDYKVAVHRNNCHRIKKLVNKECNSVSQFLIKISLSGNNLSGINLQHANLASLPLSRVNLSHAKLQHADLNHSKLTNALLTAVNVRGYKFSWGKFSQGKFIRHRSKESGFKGGGFQRNGSLYHDLTWDEFKLRQF